VGSQAKKAGPFRVELSGRKDGEALLLAVGDLKGARLSG